MKTTILQSFLNLRLLDIGPDDSRLIKLNEAGEELSHEYAIDPRAALAPLLAAWDPLSGEDPALLQLGELVQKHWPTYRSAFQGEPITLYRALVLQAVMKGMQSQGALAFIVHLMGKNVLQHLEVGKEQSVLSQLVECADAIVASRVEEMWAFGTLPTLSASASIPPVSAPIKIDTTTWISGVAAAMGPSTRTSAALSNSNPVWPNSNNNWVYEVTDRMAAVLADVHDKAASTAFNTVSKAQKGIEEAVVKALNNFTQEFVRGTAHLNRSSQLLWWRQALYSETAQKPYRNLSGPSAAFHLAMDLADLLPKIYPSSVESFLSEAVNAVVDSAKAMTLKDLLETLQKDSGICNLPRLGNWQKKDGSRSLLLQALANLCTNGSSEIPSMGVPLTLTLGLAEWSVWILREVKTLEALNTPDKVKASKLQVEVRRRPVVIRHKLSDASNESEETASE